MQSAQRGGAPHEVDRDAILNTALRVREVLLDEIQRRDSKGLHPDADRDKIEERVHPREIQAGAKRTEGWQDRHAALYYEEIRNRAAYSDADLIVQHIQGFTREEIEDIRQHMFIREQPRDGGMKRFDADYDQAQAWQRLIEGKNVRDSDVTMLRHEQMELRIMRETGCTYEEAHDKADAVYNWYREAQAGG